MVGEVGLPGFVGEFGLEPDVRRFRFLAGCGLDESVSAQDPVDRGSRDTVMRWWCLRCQPMVSAPASSPWPVSSWRSSMMVSTMYVGVASGRVWGLRDRGSSAVSPSARQRATSLETQPGETPYSRATSAWERFSITTAVMIRRALDTHQHHRQMFPMTRDTCFLCGETQHPLRHHWGANCCSDRRSAIGFRCGRSCRIGDPGGEASVWPVAG